jgi:hypothetical protein
VAKGAVIGEQREEVGHRWPVRSRGQFGQMLDGDVVSARVRCGQQGLEEARGVRGQSLSRGTIILRAMGQHGEHDACGIMAVPAHRDVGA